MARGSTRGLGGRPSLGEALVRTFTSRTANHGNRGHAGGIGRLQLHTDLREHGPSADSAYVFYSSSDGKNWQVLRVFNMGERLKPRVGFESQPPAGEGGEAAFYASVGRQEVVPPLQNFGSNDLDHLIII